MADDTDLAAPRGTRRAALRVVVSTAWHADRRRTVLTLVLFTAEALLTSSVALWLKLLLEAARRHDGGGAGLAAAALTAAVIGAFGIGHATYRVRKVLNERAHHQLERRLLGTVGRTPTLDLHETPEHLTQLELLDDESWEFGEVIPALLSVFLLVVQLVSSAALLASVHPLLLLLPLFGVPLLATSSRTGNMFAAGNELAAEPSRRAHDLYELAFTEGAAKELRLFRLRGELLARFAAAQRERRRIIVRYQVPGQLLTLGGRLVFMVGYFGAVAWVASRAADGRQSPGDVLLTAVLAGQLLGQVAQSSSVVQMAFRTLRAAGRYVYVARVAEESRAAVREDAEVPARLARGLRLEGVSYRYPGSDREVLSGIDLELPAGSTVAVVGDNGAGKSTLVKLLAGLYRPDAGRITADGVDLAELSPERWRARVTAAFQDHARFELPLREAVGIGAVAADGADGADPGAALVLAGAGDLAAGLPRGLDTPLGTAWDGGVDLSGGQWQKVALARAMMRRDPLLLLFDEPTAALDAETEHALFESWTRAARASRASSGAVTVLVSHRFSTVRMADLIVVLANGRVTELGTHADLLALDGAYAELFTLQSRAYR